jgi:hypothetical protein
MIPPPLPEAEAIAAEWPLIRQKMAELAGAVENLAERVALLEREQRLWTINPSSSQARAKRRFLRQRMSMMRP